MDYIYFERPEGDTEKSISIGIPKKRRSFESIINELEVSSNELDKMLK